MPNPPTSFEIRPDWLARHAEPALDPGQTVLDSHHHLYHRPGLRYLAEDYLADLATGHDIRASIAVQARAMLRADGPAEEAALGETEFLNGQAAISAGGLHRPARVATGIVGHADLTLGPRLRPLLERHIALAGGRARAGGRFCGIRQPLAWDADATLLNPAYPTARDLPDSVAFRAGLTVLQDLGLTFDIWAFYPQLPQMARMAKAHPGLPIAVDHLGGVVRAGAHAGKDIFPAWRAGMAELARCPNVTVKLSGFGMRLSAFGFDEAAEPPRSDQLAAVWRPWVMTALDLFGPDRCMWGSNFPVDKGSYGYATGLNAMQRLLADGSEQDRHAIFWRTAARHYGLDEAAFLHPRA